MKKLLLSLLMTVMCITSTWAHDFESGGIYYSITDETNKTVAVTFQGSSYNEFKEYTGSVTIPAKVTHNSVEYSVTSIRNGAFRSCDGLTSVTIPNSVTAIGVRAFNYCDGLTEITIPNSVTSIGYGAFYYCTGLTSVTIGNSVTSIGDYAFADCTGLTEVTIPNSVTSIGNYSFSGCTGLTSIVVDKNNTTYDSRENCNAIIETSTNTLIVGCKSSVIPESVTSIGDYAFADCTGLTEVTIPNSVTSIGYDAFYYCTGLTSVTIGNSVTSIGDYAFADCTGLTEVTIPNSVTSIGNYSFSGCTGLTSIVVDKNNTTYDSRENCNAIIETSTNTLIVGCKSSVIPESVTSIGDYAFYCCPGLTEVTIPNSITSIGDDAFLSCTGLTEITCLATTPPAINESTFNNVSKTIPLYVPVGCVEAYKAADYWKEFTNIQVVGEIEVLATGIALDKTTATMLVGESFTLTATVLPDSVTNGKVVWSSNNEAVATVDSLGNVVAVAEGTATITAKTTDGTNLTATCAIEVIKPAKFEVDGIYYEVTSSANKTVAVTSDTEKYSGAVVIPEKVTYDGVEYSVTSIGERAFYDCTGLTSVTIPNSVTAIGERAFNECRGLTSVTIPNSVTSIGVYAFNYCNGLTSLTIPASVTAIGEDAFNNCSGLASIVVAEGNTKYDSRDNCNALIETATHTLLTGCKNTTIPNSVTAIGDRAFQVCNGMVSITIPGSITSIGLSVFNGCSGLTQITCLVATPPAIESTTFNGVSKTISLFVKPGCVEAYKAAEYWKEFTNIQVVGEIPVGAVIVVDGISYKTTGTETVEVTSGTEKYSGAVVIPEKVTYDEVEYSVTAIGNSAFDECNSMTSVTLPNSITTIGDYAFYNCTGLTEITIPNSVTSIGYMGFSGCKSLTSITIPENVTSIGLYAFHVCEGLTEITSLATTPPAIDSSTFSYVSKTIPLYVPEGCVEAYKAAEHWKEFTFVVDVATVLADSIALDRDSAEMFVGDSLTLVATVLPDSVTNGKVVWSSNNEAVATVDSLGNVVAVAEGVAIITATTTDGTNLTAQCVVEVKQASGIVSTDADGVAIVTESGAIVVKNAPMGSVVNIYTIAGTVAATTQVTAPVTRIAVDTRGIYIVQVGNTAKKVVM